MPTLSNPEDVIVQIEAATVCGTDLHITQGVHPEVPLGTILGHEGIGTIIETGANVKKFRIGDRVLIPPTTSCGTCENCAKGYPAHCSGSGENGWLLGHTIDGVQAEYARIPYADNSLYAIPEGLSNEDAILAADVLPSAFEIGVVNGRVSDGDTVVIIGDGPIGLSAVITARLKNPASVILVGIEDFRLETAIMLGADHVVDSARPGWVEAVRKLCPKGGADVVIEAVGKKETLEGAFALVNTFGRVANIGVHTSPVSLPIESMWIKNLTLTTGMLSCRCVPTLLDLQSKGEIRASSLITHRFKLFDTVRAYETFSSASTSKATKVFIGR
ncbi:Alcohol dehydrogenase GroES domain protein [Paraburkholderia phymatum STM815]|uniref:Alcohol dehydrogenase GroES domain protein n=2 Tax=Paraburkholderia phymatum TaxID=148447 RepID=B2JSH7_PARP8|nr:Alcohol dehydrogenase GroES domain protein [Paraburkholderia phymatum STM815]